MLKIPNYPIHRQIYESPNSIVYRGLRQQDNQPVILKLLRENYPTPEELTRYQQEYRITHQLNISGVIKAEALIEYGNSLIIVFEDFGGESLKQLLESMFNKPIIPLNPPSEGGLSLFSSQQFNLREYLQLAIKITENLANIHQAGIIHKDINPANIVYNPETKQLKIIDFGIATLLNSENPTLKNFTALEGTLAYISPEQTGRMNRSLDYRTDFYSLGVTLSELFTGKLPFESDDALELLHCHLAKKPKSIRDYSSIINQQLSSKKLLL
jgi:serine/threonine protein kinase